MSEKNNKEPLYPVHMPDPCAKPEGKAIPSYHILNKVQISKQENPPPPSTVKIISAPLITPIAPKNALFFPPLSPGSFKNPLLEEKAKEVKFEEKKEETESISVNISEYLKAAAKYRKKSSL